jgi:hypothetical protein
MILTYPMAAPVALAEIRLIVCTELGLVNSFRARTPLATRTLVLLCRMEVGSMPADEVPAETAVPEPSPVAPDDIAPDEIAADDPGPIKLDLVLKNVGRTHDPMVGKDLHLQTADRDNQDHVDQ